MTRVAKLENEIRQLNRDELAAFRDWFRKYDSDEWDREIEKDVLAGRLDRLAEEAIAEKRVVLPETCASQKYKKGLYYTPKLTNFYIQK
jgi:hypothetical protein